MVQRIQCSEQVPDAMAGLRLDQAAANLFPDYSRSRLQSWIKSGALRINGEAGKVRDKVIGGEQLDIDATLEAGQNWQAQPLALDILFEDEHLLVIDKPAGVVVHPGAGTPDGTLLNALLHHAPELGALPRAGIVHRIDKETTGLLVVAKTLVAHHSLVEQLQEKTAYREYQAVVYGVMTSGGCVDQPIGRHPQQRTKQAVVHSGKPAVTHFRVMQRFQHHTRVKLQLETGRTHQIRVHMAHIGYPLVGDPMYGGRLRLPKGGAVPELISALKGFRRQALHAFKLGVVHPVTGEDCQWESPLPEDFANLVAALELNEATV